MMLVLQQHFISDGKKWLPMFAEGTPFWLFAWDVEGAKYNFAREEKGRIHVFHDPRIPSDVSAVASVYKRMAGEGIWPGYSGVLIC